MLRDIVSGFDVSKTMSDLGGDTMVCCVNVGHEVVACNLFICSLFVIVTMSFLEYGYVDVVVLQDLGEDLTPRKYQPLNIELDDVEGGTHWSCCGPWFLALKGPLFFSATQPRAPLLGFVLSVSVVLAS